MPNSDGSGTVDAISTVETSKEDKCSPVVNGIHDYDKSTSCRENGDCGSINGDLDDYTVKKTEYSSMTFPMKIVRKRHSDSEMLHEGAKKTKLDNCDTPRSEPSPLIDEIPHDPVTKFNELVSEDEEKKLLTDTKVISNGSTEKEEAEDDSFTSSIICIDEEPRSSVNILQYKEESEKSEPIDQKEVYSTNTVDDDPHKTKIKEEINELRFTDFGTQTISDETGIDERKLLLRSEVLSMFSENLKSVGAKSLTLFQKLAQSKTIQSNNWQSKYYHLHNRFLHLKVSTDKMIENVSKEDKESRSVEAQTDVIDLKDLKSSTEVRPQVSNGFTSNTQVNNSRQLGSHSPTKSVTGATSASPTSASAPLLPTHASQPVQQHHNSMISNVTTNHQSTSKLGSQPVDSISQNQLVQQQPSKSQQPQTLPQQTQQVLLLSTRPQTSPLQNTHVVAIASGGSNVIDLTDDDSSSNPTKPPPRSAGVTTTTRTNSRQSSSLHEPNRVRHPMALPRMTATTISHGCCRGLPPPSPQLNVTRTEDGVCLQWNIPNYTSTVYSKIKRYRLFNYSQTPQSVFYSFQNPWKEIGSVDSMDLPMACTLTQIQDNSVYHFAIRPVDEYERLGIWSNTATIEMTTLDS